MGREGLGFSALSFCRFGLRNAGHKKPPVWTNQTGGLYACRKKAKNYFFISSLAASPAAAAASPALAAASVAASAAPSAAAAASPAAPAAASPVAAAASPAASAAPSAASAAPSAAASAPSAAASAPSAAASVASVAASSAEPQAVKDRAAVAAIAITNFFIRLSPLKSALSAAVVLQGKGRALQAILFELKKYKLFQYVI